MLRLERTDEKIFAGPCSLMEFPGARYGRDGAAFLPW